MLPNSVKVTSSPSHIAFGFAVSVPACGAAYTSAVSFATGLLHPFSVTCRLMIFSPAVA